MGTMKTLQIDENKARGLFKTATPEFKETLIDTFGKDFFSQKVTDRVKTFEDACKELRINPTWNGFSQGSPDENAYAKLKVIVRALNEGWEADAMNSSQWKYYPRFYNNSGVGLSDGDCVLWNANTTVGPRLCFKSGELARYAGTQFIEIYKEYLL